MTNQNINVAPLVSLTATRKTRSAMMLSSALPIAALALPSSAIAQDAVNTATITAPAGAFEANTANNSATDTDTIYAALNAVNDDASGPFGFAGDPAVLNVFDNDTINSIAVAPADVTLSVAPTSTLPPQLTFDTATGDVGVVAGTAAGTYSFVYRICETGNPDNCVEATATVTVTAPTINAVDDAVGGINGNAGAVDVVNVLGDNDGTVEASDDTIGGIEATINNVDIVVDSPATPINGGPVPTLDTATGLVSVPAGTPAGTYSITYTIIDEQNTGNTSQATVVVTVDPPVVVADDEVITGIDGVAGQNDIINVLDGGDTLNGDPATIDNVDITVLSPATPNNPGDPVPALDPATGLVSVPPGTPSGTYTITFQICDEVNPTVCSDPVTVTVTVDAPLIEADPDQADGLNGVTGATDVINVLLNDSYDGVLDATGDVILTIETPATPLNPGDPVPTLDTTTGFVQVPPGTPAGTYVIEYRITDPINPDNFVIETATIIVAPSIDLSITKTNNTDVVTSGETITYSITVLNSGPDAATGAVLRDVPGAGLSCPANAPLTFTGDGIPAGTFTFSDLTGTGVTLGTLGNGQSVTVTYQCTVN